MADVLEQRLQTLATHLRPLETLIIRPLEVSRMGILTIRWHVIPLVSALFLPLPPPFALPSPPRDHQDSPRCENPEGQEEQPLVPGKSILRQLGGIEVHRYRLELVQGQYAYVAVAQQGADVVVALRGPDGDLLAEVDSPEGISGVESLSLIAETPGIHSLEVRSVYSRAGSGRYEIRVIETRASTADDQSRVTALRIFNEAGQLHGQATADSLQKAPAKYKQAASLWRALGDPSGEARAFTRIGSVYSILGEHQSAFEYYSQGLPLWQAVGDRRGEATVRKNIGLLYHYQGEVPQALGYYRQALQLSQSLRDRRGEAETLQNLAGLYSQVGEKQKALDSYKEALRLVRVVGDRELETIALNGLGFVYRSLGRHQKALRYFEEALEIWQVFGQRQVQAYTLNYIAGIHNDLGNHQKALVFLNEALPLIRGTGDRRGEANILDSIGRGYYGLHEPQRALQYHGDAEVLRRSTGDRWGEAETLTNIGVAHAALGEHEIAVERYRQALALRQTIGDPQGEVTTLYHLARAERQQGRPLEALAHMKAALEILERLRTRVGSLNLRASYFVSAQRNYELFIDLLMGLHQQAPAEGFDAKALEAGERARARSFLEFLGEARANIREGVEQTLLQRERSLQQLLSAKLDWRLRLLSGKGTEKQASEAAKELEGLTAEYEQLQAEIRTASPRYAALTQPQPLSLREIQQKVVDRDTLLLEYSLGEQRSFLWAVTPASLTTYELPCRAEVESAARRLYELLTARNQRRPSETTEQKERRIAEADAQYRKQAEGLSRILLGPVAGELHRRRLLIVPDGALFYLPFAALPDPRGLVRGGDAVPLMVEHEIVSLPSASSLAILRREFAGRLPAPKRLAVLADPVFEKIDERVSASASSRRRSGLSLALGEHRVQDELFEEVLRSASDGGLTGVENVRLPRLPFTREEAEAILALVPAGQRKRALDFDASRATATNPELAQYQFLHFATHGLLNSFHPELSGIILSLVDREGRDQQGFLSGVDVYNLKLAAELVVLSGCRTALGEEIKGEGFVGLTRGFMYAGAARVMASLWRIDDAATAELMTRFYRGLLGQDQLSPAAALRAAQLSMWRQNRWRAPYYWSAFTLQGDWN